MSLSQVIRYEYDGPVRDVRQRLVVVPPARHGSQRRRGWRLAVSGVGRSSMRRRLDSFGNLVLEVSVPRVASFVEFDVSASVSLGPPAVHRVRPDRRYLSSTRLTRADAAIRRLASHDPAEVCSAVHGSFRYEWGVTGVGTPAASALAGGVGVCQDYAHVMVAACRSAGVAARYVSGHLAGEGGSHAWVEVLRPDPSRSNSWVIEAWDPTHDRRCGDGYVTVAVGRDYADVAPMSGTYDGDGVSGSLSVRKKVSALAR